MRVRQLDENRDMTFGNSQLNFYKDSVDGVVQSVLTRLRLWRGEWYLDTDEGTDYVNGVLGKSKQSSIEPLLRERILNTQGVREILSFSITIDENKRNVSVQCTIDTLYGEANVAGVF